MFDSARGTAEHKTQTRWLLQRSKNNMKEKQKFVLIFLLTILFTRIIVFFIPRTTFIYTDQFHHAFIGIFLLVIYAFIRNQYLLAVLLGLVIDQITQAPFYIADLFNYNLVEKSFWSYWSNYSVVSTTILIIISIILIKKYKR